MRSMYKFVICLSLALLGACASGGSESTTTTSDQQAENKAPAPSNQQSQPSPVINKLEKVGEVTYKIYLQPEANAGNRKGVVLLGSGNEPTALKPASLDGALENKTAEDLAKSGYVTAVVAYRLQPNVNFADGGVSWENNSREMGIDFSNVADDIISKVGGELTRSKVLTGGVSYTAYMLLDNIAKATSPLADTRGLLSAHGATDATTFTIPIFALNCNLDEEGGAESELLISKIADGAVKGDSGSFVDLSCTQHGAGDVNTQAAKLVERAKLWLP